MAEQKPQPNAVTYIIATLLAKTVNSQKKLKGMAMANNVRLRPYRMATPPSGPPNRAPSNDKLAIHEPS